MINEKQTPSFGSLLRGASHCTCTFSTDTSLKILELAINFKMFDLINRGLVLQRHYLLSEIKANATFSTPVQTAN